VITTSCPGETIDETELDDELAEMEQEQLDDKMLKTGTVLVADKIHRLPAVVNGDREPPPFLSKLKYGANALAVKKKQPAHQEEDDEEELRKLQVEMAM
jgi:charged multivesicular body protein 4